MNFVFDNLILKIVIGNLKNFIRCDTPCEEGKWGLNCSKTCSCKNGATCDKISGICNCTAGKSLIVEFFNSKSSAL